MVYWTRKICCFGEVLYRLKMPINKEHIHFILTYEDGNESIFDISHKLVVGRMAFDMEPKAPVSNVFIEKGNDECVLDNAKIRANAWSQLKKRAALLELATRAFKGEKLEFVLQDMGLEIVKVVRHGR